MSGVARVLVIKLSALGDMVQAFPAFDRIRAAHGDAHITLLTTWPYAALAAAGPWFEAVDGGGRPENAADALGLIRRLRRARYDLVYDLQGNDRTNVLFQALRPFPPLWSGVAFGCALPTSQSRPDEDAYPRPPCGTAAGRRHLAGRAERAWNGARAGRLMDAECRARGRSRRDAACRSAGPWRRAVSTGQTLAGRTLRRSRAATWPVAI